MDRTEDRAGLFRGRSDVLDSGWWLHHASLSVALWIGVPISGAGYVLSEPASMYRTLAMYGVASFGFVVFVTVWGALFGYYYDAKALRREDAPWVPTWWVWAACHLPFWPVVAPLYVIERHRRIGLPLPAVPSVRLG